MQTKKILSVSVAVLMLSACQQGGPGAMNGGSGFNKQDIGMLGGAIGGGVIGSTMGKGSGKTATTIAGALVGGLIGNEIGKSLDNADRAAMSSTTQRALETGQAGQSLPWNNKESGHSGTVTPSNYYTNSNGQYCREYTQSVTIDGKSQQAHGTACREPDGTWQIAQ